MRILVVAVFTIACLPLPAQQRDRAPAKLDFAAAAEFSEENAGLALLAYRGDELVFEEYHNGHTAKRGQHIFSGTKSFAPVVALIAQDEGLLTLDEKVFETITEWRGDELREQITVRQLLNFTSGLKNNDSTLHRPGAKDVYGLSIDCKCAAEPGKRFRYGSNHLMVFGEFMKRKLAASKPKEGEHPVDFVAYLEDRVLDPIGCTYTRWLRDRQGNPGLPYGAYMTAREWAKFGLLVRDRGKHGDQQLIPTEYFDEMFQGSKANPVYGLNFWLVGKRANGTGVPKDIVSASGMYNQRLYICESEDLVVVRLGQTGKRKRYSDRAFLTRLFGG
ncbi:MAG: serine hydrolase [Planctomycetota bacterium]|nr:serine hydrolase [Planctomycetota bacterium]